MRRMTFRPIRFKQTVTLICAGCNKKLKRTFSDYFTINPFNTGSPAECEKKCLAKIEAKIQEARDEGVLCRACDEEMANDQ